MIVEYIRYEAPDDPGAIVKAYEAAAPHLEAAPECLGYEVTQGIEEPAVITVRIEWTSVHDHEQGFRRGPHFAAFLALVRPFIPLIREMKHHERRLAGGRGERSR